MRKLLLATVAVLALAGSAQAQGRAVDSPVEGLQFCREVSMLVLTCVTASGKPTKVVWNGGTGKVDALDDGDQLAVMNLLPSPDGPRVWKYSYTPAGQLPACDAAEMIYWLAGSRRPLGAVLGNPTLLGTIKGKNMCRANVAGYIVTYTVELMDDGRWWVQRTR